MKVNDVTKSEDQALYEALDADNDTGVDTSDLVKIAKAHRENNWTRYETLDDFIKYLDNLTDAAINGGDK